MFSSIPNTPAVTTAHRERSTLVVIEGIDGSGKTTLARSLVRKINDLRGGPVRFFPNANLAVVRDTLDAIAAERGMADRRAMLGPEVAQMLAAVLKLRDYDDITGELDVPGVVVVDRYFYTHLALARATARANYPRLVRLYAELPRPDVALLLRVDPEVAFDRVQRRGTDSNSLGFLQRFADAYDELASLTPELRIVSGEIEPNAVVELAWREVQDAVTAR